MKTNQKGETPQGHKLLSHTADAGIIAWGGTLNEALAQAAVGLFSLICALEEVHPRRRWSFTVTAPSLDLLLVEFLDEILFLHEVELAVFQQAIVETVEEKIDTGHWRATGYFTGEKVDTKRHEIYGHVKAVTLHELAVLETDQGWRLNVIVDL